MFSIFLDEFLSKTTLESVFFRDGSLFINYSLNIQAMS